MKKTPPNEIISAIITGVAVEPLSLGEGESWHERRRYPGLVDGYTLTIECKRAERLVATATLTRPDGTDSFSTGCELETAEEFSQYAKTVAQDVARIGLVDPDRFELIPVI